MQCGSPKNISGHSGVVGGLGEEAGDHAIAAGAGSSDVGSASDIVGVEKLVGAEAGEECSGGCEWRHRRSLWRRQQWCGGDGGGTC
jgi:hypothetical protein